jgi:hypothetical protein
MRKKIEWTTRVEDRVKRTVRVAFPGPNRIRWQTKRSDEEKWQYDQPPLPEDWEMLLERLEAGYRRGRYPYKHLELAKAERQKARDKAQSRQEREPQ